MFTSHGGSQELESIRALIVIIAVIAVMYWRAVLKLMAILIVVLLTSGAVALFQGISRH